MTVQTCWTCGSHSEPMRRLTYNGAPVYLCNN